MSTTTESGAKIIIHASDVPAFEDNMGIMVSSGFAVDIAITRV